MPSVGNGWKNKYTIKNLRYNQDIVPGQVLEIGLSGQENYSNPLEEFALINHHNEHEKEEFEIEYQIISEWDEVRCKCCTKGM